MRMAMQCRVCTDGEKVGGGVIADLWRAEERGVFTCSHTAQHILIQSRRCNLHLLPGSAPRAW